MMTKFFSTKEVIELTGFSKDTLRYYEKIGIISNVIRNRNNYRQYTEENINWLILVQYLKKLNISTNEIAKFPNLTIEESKIYIKNYQQEIRNKIKELNDIDDKLTVKLEALNQERFEKSRSLKTFL
ncbi:MerR family transcriptional regulator [Staphylococcus sp. ACRSN]|uniref:MerR family transcriptional regulator n=1 Tax=Staphylococcus sp. ACRSN TaxID=2918214 RepID=UPI001EF231A9|nr:MerR family transcriptional regulator [Staphylococcus sp. ACRSN]MCG7338936.1 MerR family transcriptional regulator [Staphylococcus sp. ACRSN]